MMVEVQCSSCHTRYRVDGKVLPEGTPTFKCSRCGHVFSVEPRRTATAGVESASVPLETRSQARSAAAAVKSPPDQPAERPPEPDSVQPPPPADDSARSARPAAPPTGPKPAYSDRPPQVEPSAKPSSPQPATEGLTARPSEDRQTQPESRKNLAFDFDEEYPDGAAGGDEPGARDQVDPEAARDGRGDFDSTRQAPPRWQVGDDPDPGMAARSDHFVFETTLARQARGAAAARGPGPQMLDEDEAPVYNRGVTRSVRFFLALIFLVACGFGAMTVAIHAAPAAALDLLNRLPFMGGRFVSPVVPAQMVALRGIHADYRHGRDGRLTLVVEGEAENVSARALRTVRIKSRIWASTGGALAQLEVYCGNNLSTRTVPQMTSHEIQFFEGLPPPKSFTLESSSSCPFVIVFVDPPAQLSHFDVAVTEADPVEADEAAASTS